MLTKPRFFYDHTTKQALGFQNPFYLKKAQQLEPKIYDGNVIKSTNAILIPDSKETLMLAEESLSKMLLKQQDPMVLEKKVNTTPVDYNSMNSSDPSPSCRPTKVEVGDEAVHKELGDRMERAATTASSLEAKQDSDAQTRFEATFKKSNDLPLSRVNTLGSGEDNMKLMELMFLIKLFIHQMANLEFCDKHNMVAYLIKSEGSEDFHEIIDFLSGSHISYALTESPILYMSLIEQFWQTAALSTTEDGVQAITATIDGREMIITEASLRRHLKLEDSEGLPSLPNEEIFEQLTNIGYAITSDSLTFFKGHFSPQWKFFIHTILHCMSSKKTAWDQFSSNIATAIICLATYRTFNFSKFIFEAMVKNLNSPHKFLTYPRFIQIILNKHQRLLLPHTRTYPTPTLTNKLFNNIRRPTKGYSRVIIPLFDTMLVQPQGEAPSTSPSRITSSPSYHITSSIPTTSSSIQTHHDTEEPVTMPHDSPLYSVHSHRSDDGRLKQTILTDLVTKLSDRVKVLEKDLQQTKKTYSTALTKLVLRVEKLENQLKSGKARRRSRIILSEDEDEKQSDDIEVLIEEEEPTELVEDQGSGEKGEREVSIAGAELSTRKDGVNTASATPDVSTASEMGSAAGIKAKDKGKGIMQESEPSKKIKKMIKIQMTIDEELAKKVFEEEQERFNAEQEARAKEEQEQENSDFEITQKLQKQLDSIDWNTVAEQLQERQNMAGYKMDYFKGMSYDDIRPIFKVEYNKVQTLFKNRDVEEEKGQKVLEESAEKTEIEQVKIESSKKARGSRKKSLARKRGRETPSEESSKKHKIEDDVEKEVLQGYLTIVSEDEGLDVASLVTKYPIVDWES
ncbi:hypothetical protein Tco_0834114 [Tanacetum coccineum]